MGTAQKTHVVDLIDESFDVDYMESAAFLSQNSLNSPKKFSNQNGAKGNYMSSNIEPKKAAPKVKLSHKVTIEDFDSDDDVNPK